MFRHRPILNIHIDALALCLNHHSKRPYRIRLWHQGRKYEKTQATLRLMNELAKGRKSGEEKGWLTLEAVEKELGIVNESFAFIQRSPKRSFRNQSLC